MSIDARFGALVIAALVASPTACLAQAGVIGCNELPEYDRAVGTIENGDQSCGMTTAEANRILAQHEAETRAATQPVVVPAAPRHYHHRHHKHVAPPM